MGAADRTFSEDAGKRYLPLFLVFVLLVKGIAAVSAQTEPVPPPLLPVADFDRGVQNRLGGYHNVSERLPSTVSMTRVSDVYRGGGGKSLRIAARQRAGGMAAVWLSFYDFTGAKKEYLDARRYGFLSFWVKGERGGEEFGIKIADGSWAARQDGLSLGRVSDFLPGGTATEWREVLIPLEEFPSLDRKAMASLTFDFGTQGDHTVFVDDIAFKNRPDHPTPLTPKPKAAREKRRSLPRALWNWNPLPLLLDPERRKDFFSFCRREHIGIVWMQLPARFTRSGEEAEDLFRAPGTDFRAEILHQSELRSFLAAAHDEGIRVEALDGAPEYAAKAYHSIPLAVVDAVIAFNGKGAPKERFDGVHFDNEPYLLAGWHLPSLRERIMNEFLELNVECQRRIRSRSDMEYGIDIPFWWQSPDPETGSAIAPASLDGVRKAASFHVIDRLDSVGIMNYRNTAEGADGLLAHGLTLLDYAGRARGAKVFIGVETITEPPADVWFAAGLPRKESGEALNTRAGDLLFRSRINGFRIHVLDDGAHLHFGIAIPSRPSPDQDRAVRETMAFLAERLGASGANIGKTRTEEILQAAFRKIARDPEWRDPKTRTIGLPEGNAEYAGFEAKNILLSKISFGYRTIPDMRRELEAAEEEFGEHEQFAGMAIHHYDSYREMVDSAGRTDTRR